jgi:serine/threonine protein kinase
MDSVDQDFKQLFSAVPEIELSEDHIIVLLYNALSALKFVHKANIVHRDIKPANMLVDSSCRVLLCDFGLARVLPRQDKIFIAIQKKLYK